MCWAWCAEPSPRRPGGTNEAFPRVGAPDGAPPDWVRPGTRLTWYGETASVRTSPYTYVEDPDGDWEDPTTGKRYRQTETDEMPTAAARGWTHTDVLAVDGDRVALETTLWPIGLTSDQLSVVPLGGGVFPGAAVDGAWVRADLLAGVESGRTGNLQMLRGAYQLGEATVDSVAFLSRAEGSYASTVFDASSGALIATTSRAQAEGSQVHGPLDDPQGNVSIVWTRLADLRQRDLPGLGSPLPDWVAPGLTLTDAGSIEHVNALDPSAWVSIGRVPVRRRGRCRWATYGSGPPRTSGLPPESAGRAPVARPALLVRTRRLAGMSAARAGRRPDHGRPPGRRVSGPGRRRHAAHPGTGGRGHRHLRPRERRAHADDHRAGGDVLHARAGPRVRGVTRRPVKRGWCLNAALAPLVIIRDDQPGKETRWTSGSTPPRRRPTCSR